MDAARIYLSDSVSIVEPAEGSWYWMRNGEVGINDDIGGIDWYRLERGQLVQFEHQSDLSDDQDDLLTLMVYGEGSIPS